jgi:hypothetical protein
LDRHYADSRLQAIADVCLRPKVSLTGLAPEHTGVEDQGRGRVERCERDRGSALRAERVLGPLRASPDAVGRRLGDRSVVVNLKTNRIYELNRTASTLWELLEAGCDRTQLEQAMLDQFDVGRGVLSREIDEALSRLASAGLVAGDVGG